MIQDMDEETRLYMVAEEATELAQAALKLARVIRGKNPTPVKEAPARKQMYSEIADVFVTTNEIIPKKDLHIIDEICVKKLARWKKRLEEAATDENE